MPQALSQTSITWVDLPRDIDLSFLEETPGPAMKVGQAVVEPFIQDAFEKLFQATTPHSWAFFPPFKGYSTRLKRVFQRKVLASFSAEIASEILDNFHEAEGESEEGEKIYEMLSCLQGLNALLEEIHLRILSTLRS